MIHGTFDAPDPAFAKKPQYPAVLKWYEPGGQFCLLLDEALQAKGSGARCWKHCEVTGEVFTWSGANNWVDRQAASQSLAEYIKSLHNEGWVVHVIAHSHGGNIAVNAIRLSVQYSMEQAKILTIPPSVEFHPAYIVTLGTPFFHFKQETDNRSGVVRRFITSGLLLASISTVLIYVLSKINVFSQPNSVFGWACFWIGITFASLLFGHIRLMKASADGGQLLSGMREYQQRMLVLTSDNDEVHQLFARLRAIKDPFVRATSRYHRRQRWQAQFDLARAVDRLRFAAHPTSWRLVFDLWLRACLVCVGFVVCTVLTSFMLRGFSSVEGVMYFPRVGA